MPVTGPACPCLSRRHAAGAPSARGLLFTLLGEFVLPGGGTAWTSAVVAAFARLGVEEKATRQALMRTAAAGWLEAEKTGRRTRWHLTPAARRLLTDGAERIYSFTGPGRGLGRPLAAGLGADPGQRPPGPARGPHPAELGRLRLARRRACGSARTRSARPRRPGAARGRASPTRPRVRGDPDRPGRRADMVATAWDLAAIEQEYEQFIDEFRGRAPGDVLARQVELVHAWRRFPAIDPALPRELLPARWSGLAAARLFADRHRTLVRRRPGGVEPPESVADHQSGKSFLDP